jgi:peptide/nickel transport system substrate-binding protein
LDGNYDTLVIPANINRNVYDGLFRFDDNLQLQPHLALSFTQPDPSTYEVTLRPDVKFHDGSALTSADVVNSFNRIMTDTQLHSKQATYVSNLASVDAPGPNEVVFHLKQPDATWIAALGGILYITPKGVIDTVGDETFAANPVGTGPFKFVEWVKGDHVTLAANCDYWMGPPKVSHVKFTFISEPATEVAALQTGQIDLAPLLPADQAAPLRSDSNLTVTTVNGGRNIWVSMNTLADGPFQDQLVRQAMNYAVNKDSIVANLLNGAGVASGQPYNPNVFGYNPNVKPYPYDIDMAKQLLTAAGYGNGLDVTFYNDQPIQAQVWQAVAADLEAVGVHATLKTDPNFFSDTFLKKTMGPNDFYILGCTNLLLDADFCTGLHFDSVRRGLYFHTPADDALIAKARAEVSVQERQQDYYQLAQDLHEQAPVIYLYSTIDTYALSKDLVFTPRGDGAIYLWAADKN